MDNNILVEISLGELCDRALRFQLHLDAIESEFYTVSAGLAADTIPRDKPVFLESFRHCIWMILETVMKLSVASKEPINDGRREQFLGVIRSAFLCIDRLHNQELVHLPRPSESIELRRFCRVISKHVLSDETTNLSVYVTEATIDGSYAGDPISRIKSKEFGRFADLVNDLPDIAPLNQLVTEGAGAIHVTIARIDARNPVRWPTLFHEAAHKLLNLAITDGKPLDVHFREWLPAELLEEISTLKFDTLNWLTEIWCDLLAALVMGPAFFFSQFAAFVAAPPVVAEMEKHYPPHGFRLRLIAGILQHHYPELMASKALRKHVQECVSVIEYWDKSQNLDVASNRRLKIAFDGMRGFFQEHFFSGSGTDLENFQQKFEKMVKYVRAIDASSLLLMQQELKKGLPIPSKPRNATAPLVEEPSSLQEVLLVAWMVRLETLRGDTLRAFTTSVPADWEAFLETTVLPSIARFDDAVLRSIQLAEWLHLLGPDAVTKVIPASSDLDLIKSKRPALLTDREIVALLSSKELRVLPLVNLEQQLGSTSLDIRLGTSFEVFLPAYRHTSGDDFGSFESYDSRRIDLDYLEHVVLLPGQFMLAHSFEYLKFPDWVAADLDGRSSYARLGLEIHMTAGMIDPGFEGVVTFELFNSGPNPIQLFPGLRIAQLRFSCVTEPARPYSKQHTAKYRGLLQHNRSLYKNDADFIRIKKELEESDCRRKHEQRGT
jgi:dCTP deaminase